MTEAAEAAEAAEVADRHAVLAAAERRAAALAAADAPALLALLHPGFRWSTHTGQRLDRAAYVARNTGGPTVWRAQVLRDADVVVVGDTAVLTAVVEDTVAVGADRDEIFRMPVTMTWVRSPGGWRCLAGHAGPRLST